LFLLNFAVVLRNPSQEVQAARVSSGKHKHQIGATSIIRDADLSSFNAVLKIQLAISAWVSSFPVIALYSLAAPAFVGKALMRIGSTDFDE
jgi:hypothetical protein